LSDREKAALRGPVRTCVEEAILPEGGTYSISTEYSADGRLLTLRTIHSDGIEWIRTQSYEADGRLAKTVYGNSREPGLESVYSYDGAGRLLSITNSPREGDRIDFHFDEQGGKTATHSFDPKTPKPCRNTEIICRSSRVGFF
jgi:hypothetical protein